MRRLVKHFARLLSRLPTGATLGWFGLELEEITLVLLCFVASVRKIETFLGDEGSCLTKVILDCSVGDSPAAGNTWEYDFSFVFFSAS